MIQGFQVSIVPKDAWSILFTNVSRVASLSQSRGFRTEPNTLSEAKDCYVDKTTHL